MGTEVKERYQRMSPPQMLCRSTAEEALAKLGLDWPTLHVGYGAWAAACEIVRSAPMNLKMESSLGHYEWYVEWGGKRVGSNVE